MNVLNEFLANLIVEEHNLQNLIWNTSSKESKEILKKEKKTFSKTIDTIGKRIKQKKEAPITNLLKIEEISQIKSMQSRDYTKEQVEGILTNDFTYLKDYTKDLLGYFSSENDPVTSHILLTFLLHLEEF